MLTEMHLLDVGDHEHRVPAANTPVSRFGDHDIPIILTISAVFSVRPDIPGYYFELGYSLLLSHPLQLCLPTLCHLRIENVVEETLEK